MVFHMKTTLNIDDGVYSRLKAKAAQEGRTVSDLVDAAIRMLLERPSASRKKLPALPAFKMGAANVDVSDRDALFDAIDGPER